MQNFDREARLKASGVLFDLIEKSEISFRDLNLLRKIFLFAGIFHGRELCFFKTNSPEVIGWYFR